MSNPRRAIVVGSGVAGLTTALTLGDCLVITKTELGEGSSTWAQGGIAVAMDAHDDPGLHAADTIAVAGGLANDAVVRLVTAGGPERIEWLRELGARFDTQEDGRLQLGREAGHRLNRIVHANGDATGAELMRTLRTAVRKRPDIEVMEYTTALDIVRTDDRAAGVIVLRPDRTREVLLAPSIVLATGGIGRVYAHTTNPSEVSGDGFAMAVRIGAVISDAEFMQFHPTGLRSTLDPMPLLTEALRGDGSTLVDEHGERYMVGVHADGDLAPRDVVARATWQVLSEGRQALLDATHIGSEFPERFPTVFASAVRAGIDPRVEPLPVSPTAHYHMGGIKVDIDGRSSVPGLFAVGETSVTGLHGANRLASNSLLEGLVMGVRVARAIQEIGDVKMPRIVTVPDGALQAVRSDDVAAIEALRRMMWDNVGVIRHEIGLADALAAFERLRPRLESGVVGRNLLQVAVTVTSAALMRRESRGGHHRVDYPDLDETWAQSSLSEPIPVPSTPTIVTAQGAA